MSQKFKLNYDAIPVLAIGFTRSTSIFAKGIQLIRGILKDKGEPNHSFIVTEDHGQLFATEETLCGLQEKSLEQYTKASNRIVAMYLWQGFDSTMTQGKVQEYLAEIRRRNAEPSKYDWKGLLSFVPGFKKIIKPDPKKQWCSENCAHLLKENGAPFIDKVEIAPDELLKRMKNSCECVAILGYYQ